MSSILERVKDRLPTSGPLASGLTWRISVAVAVVGLAAPALVVSAPPIGLVVGEPAPRTFRASRQVQFEDVRATEQHRDAARDRVEPVLRFDAEAPDRALGRVSAFFEALEGVDPADEARAARLGRQHGVTAETVVAAAGLDEDARRQAARITEDLVSTLMTGRFDDDGLANARLRLHESTSLLRRPEEVRLVVSSVGAAALRPTLLEDTRATAAAREDAAATVPPVVVVKQAGENIVVRGEIVTEHHMDIVASLGLLDGAGPRAVAAAVGLLSLLVGAVAAYLYRYERRVYDRMGELLVVATLFVGMIVLTRAVLWVFPEVSPYTMPVALAPILATLLISPRIGLVMTLVTATGGLLLGLTNGLSVAVVLVSGITAVVAMSSLTQRRSLAYAGIAIVGVTAAAAGVATLAASATVEAAGAAAGYGAAGGLMSVVLAYGLLPFFEHVFGVTTDVRLLELSSPSAPLLRELMAKAPGTYSHSVLAGSLAETAADAIGANPLLARVGAYYHDIGKIARPVFFAENLNGGDNPHDDKTPWLSASIITAHVRDGILLGERNRLPREIVEIIRQHHGDSLVAYFYGKAAGSGQPVYEADFRYSGERPQSPEAALVMLADSVEAALRSISGPSLPEVEAAVREVVREKVDDNQLDDSALTLADIETVVRVYARMLVSIYHPRVKYPSCPMRRPQDAGQRYEPSRP